MIYTQQAATYDLRIINDENSQGVYDIEVAGDLTDYVKTSKTSVSFAGGKQQETVTVSVNIPSGTRLSPGDYVVRLIIKEHSYGAQGMTALVGVVSKLTVTIPGEGSFVQAKLYAPNFARNTTNSFAVEVTNKGNRPAENCFIVVDVYSSLNYKIVSLASERNTVQPASASRILLPWKPDQNNGMYNAEASVVCDGTSASSEGSFSIGSPDISISDFSPENFRLGSINKFNMLLSSNWGEQISGVYADAEVTKGDTSVFRVKTETLDMPPLQKAMVPVYIDTTGFEAGDYSVYLTLHYLDQQTGKLYSVKMLQDRAIVSSLSGMVAGGAGEPGGGAAGGSGGGMMYLLIFAVLVIAVVNIVLVVRLLRKRREK
jgi:hypothetical protein